MNQAESVDGLRNVALAIATLAITFVATFTLYQSKAEPRRQICPHARSPYGAHLEYDLHSLQVTGASIVIDVR